MSAALLLGLLLSPGCRDAGVVTERPVPRPEERQGWIKMIEINEADGQPPERTTTRAVAFLRLFFT